MKEVVLGLSGGVDSAVSARLLQDMGYKVRGLFLDIGNAAARTDALSAAEALGVDLRVEDISAALEREVCAPFAESYLRGETPNPCILCNPAVKFHALLSYADALGGAAIATGHYAAAENGALYRGRPANDQSYMLCRIRRQQLERLVLPLRSFPKREVRLMAEEFGLPVAHKPDSMEICFIPDKNYVNWLGNRISLPPVGKLLLHGEVVGTHRGIHCYTVGQRLPGLIEGRKVYISRINASDNTIELAWWEELFQNEVKARDINWLCDPPQGEIEAAVRIRHTKWENPPCTAVIQEDGSVLIRCSDPVRAPAAGQSAVLYSGDRVLGGGFIFFS